MSALILPEPPQSFDAFGLNLNGYLAQPGSAFIVNRYGFDTGHRKFIVNTDVADLGAFALGTPDFKYSKMYVHKVTNEVIGGPWTIADVEFLGQIFPGKPHEVSTDTDLRKTNLNVTNLGLGGWTTLGFQLEVAEVTAQDIYIQDTLPDLNLAGSAFNQILTSGPQPVLVPPISLPPPNVDSLSIATGLPPGAIKIWRWWWELKRRSLRIAGTPPSPPDSNTRRFITGQITLQNGSKNFTGGAKTLFLTELAQGDTIFVSTVDKSAILSDSGPWSYAVCRFWRTRSESVTPETVT